MLYPTHLIATIPIFALSDLSAIPLLIGAAIPDIIDKPLPKLGIVDTYHSLAHSLLFIFLLTGVGLFYEFVLVVAIGVAYHIAIDVVHVFINGRASHWKFVLWPFAFQDDPMRKPPVDFFKYYVGSRSFYVEVVIWVVCISILVSVYTNILSMF